MPRLSFLVLTWNEEVHIRRCIDSIKNVSSDILVVDSFSTDSTAEICKDLKVEVIKNEFNTHAEQVNFGIEILKQRSEWLFRIDADEYLSTELINYLNLFKKLRDEDVHFSGYYVSRIVKFQNQTVKYGGMSSRKVLRLFRLIDGECEQRLMDEHMIVKGNTGKCACVIFDECEKGVERFLQKHISYAKREALQTVMGISDGKFSVNTGLGFRVSTIRFLKNKIYYNLPPRLRPTLYFIFRYIILFGFWDTGAAKDYHFLQALWYRRLVEIYIAEITCTSPASFSKKHGINVPLAKCPQ